MRNHRLNLLLCLALMGMLALACAGTGTIADPRIEFEKPDVLPETGPIAVEPLSFEEEIELADKLRNSGQHPEAAWHYVRGLQLDQTSPVPRQRLGYMQLSRDVDRAERIFGDLVDEHPEMSSGHLGLGLAQIASGKQAAARTSLESVLEIDSGSAMAHMGLGMLDDKQGAHADAVSHYQSARKRNPGQYQIENNLGMSYLISGHFEQAEEAFREAIFLEPRDPALYNNLAIALARQGEYSGALQNFREYGSKADAFNNLGYVCIMNGEFERAIRYFEHSLLAGPTNRTTVLVNLRAAEDAFLNN